MAHHLLSLSLINGNTEVHPDLMRFGSKGVLHAFGEKRAVFKFCFLKKQIKIFFFCFLDIVANLKRLSELFFRYLKICFCAKITRSFTP